jgi:hypothetical protein
MAKDLTVIFALLGFTGVKAVHKTLMKLTPSLRIFWADYK